MCRTSVPGISGDRKPTPRQVSLLRASLLHGAPAIAAWLEWSGSGMKGIPDSASQWLMPLLYRNLASSGVPAAVLRPCENVYRHTWYKNHILLSAVLKILERAGAEGGRWLVLRSSAWALAYYPDLGCRGIHPLDLLVPEGDWRRIVRAFEREGWETGSSSAACLELSDPIGQTVSLHRTALSGGFTQEASRRAVAVRYLGWELLVLSPEDQLTHIAARVADWDNRSSLLWIADLAMLLAGAPVDWRELMGVAGRFGLDRTVRAMGEYLEDLLGDTLAGGRPRSFPEGRSQVVF